MIRLFYTVLAVPVAGSAAPRCFGLRAPTLPTLRSCCPSPFAAGVISGSVSLRSAADKRLPAKTQTLSVCPVSTPPSPEADRQKATQLSRSRRVLRTAGVGHSDPFPPPGLNGRYPFS
jgi:hypothetical protein